jgi:polyisoprenoid-binding protein YceI
LLRQGNSALPWAALVSHNHHAHLPIRGDTNSEAMMATWNIDGSHSTASFSVKHLMISNVRGEFEKLAGTVSYDPDKPEDTLVDVTIDASSINTREPQRDAHLKSADFFDVEHYPNLTFKSKRTTRSKDGLTVIGELTMHGLSKEVALQVEGLSPTQKDPWGKTRMGTSAHTTIKRSDWKMVWNNLLEAGGVVVSDEVKVYLDIELVEAA